MNPTAIFIAGLILLPALAWVIWTWFAMAKVEEELSAVGGFEHMHFEIGRQAAGTTEGAR